MVQFVKLTSLLLIPVIVAFGCQKEKMADNSNGGQSRAVLGATPTPISAGRWKKVWNAREFLNARSSATIAWPGHPNSSRIWLDGYPTTMVMHPWMVSLPNDVTNIHVPVAVGKYELMSQVYLRKIAEDAVSLDICLANQGTTRTLHSLTLKPGENKPLDYEFDVRSSGSELVLQVRMVDGAKGNSCGHTYLTSLMLAQF